MLSKHTKSLPRPSRFCTIASESRELFKAKDLSRLSQAYKGNRLIFTQFISEIRRSCMRAGRVVWLALRTITCRIGEPSNSNGMWICSPGQDVCC